MDVAIIGAGPGGLLLANLLKSNEPDWNVNLYERKAPGETFGLGVVFSQRTRQTYKSLETFDHSFWDKGFVNWSGINVHYKDEHAYCPGHVFSAIERKHLLIKLTEHAQKLGVKFFYSSKITNIAQVKDTSPDLIVLAEGASGHLRSSLDQYFKSSVSWGKNKYLWTRTSKRLNRFQFVFKENNHGVWVAHAYPYSKTHSAFIIEVEQNTWLNSGMEHKSESEAKMYLNEIFRHELSGHSLDFNYTRWRNFMLLNNQNWYHDNVVLLGDTAHTAHFSIGSGAKLAFEDAIALSHKLKETSNEKENISSALLNYQVERKRAVLEHQNKSNKSREWFENTSHYYQHHNQVSIQEFTVDLLSRTGTYNRQKIIDAGIVIDE